MNEYQGIQYADIRAMVRLINDLHDIPDAAERQRHMLQSLCKLLRASVGFSATLKNATPRTPWRIVSCADIGWAGKREREIAFSQADLPDPIPDPMQGMVAPRLSQITRLRRQVVDDSRWYKHDHINEIRRPARIDDCVYSLFPLPKPGWTALVCLHRPWADRQQFSEYEARLLDLFHTELSNFYSRQNGAPHDHQPAPLTDRQRQTLQLLLTGASEKQVASKLGLSRHTIHVYIQALYRRFNVNTRAELLSKFVNASLD